MWQPYTYLIGWSKHDKWYYGCQYGQKANPCNLWNTYFTSSKEVQRFRNQYGDPDIIEVRKTFDTAEKTRIWEEKVLCKIGAVTSDKWLNMQNAGKQFVTKNGYNTKKAIEVTKQKVLDGTHIFLSGDIQRKEHKKKLLDGSHHLLGSTVNNIMLNRGTHCSQKKIKCEHCDKTVDAANYGRWHGNNCKKKIVCP